MAPWDLTAFVGRDVDRGALRQLALAREGEPALATLFGIAGAGKTRLARVVASDLEEAMPGGRVFVGVDAGTGALADALGAPSGGDPVERAARALTLRERTLVVLDHTDAAPDAVVAALPAWLSAGAHVFLVVARAPLEVRGARRIAVGALGEDEALALLERRLEELGAAAPAPEAARRLVARVGGLPLAIELLAASLRVRTPEEIERGAPLVMNDEDVPERHRSLERALDETWRDLPAAERVALAVAAGFEGPFEAGAYDAVAAEVGEAAAVDRLVGRGLVARAGQRLDVMACLRRSARDHIGPDEARRIAAAHATAALATGDARRLLAAADALAPHASPSPSPSPSPSLSPSPSPSDADLAVRALLAAARALERRGDVATRRAAIARALELAASADLPRREAEAHVAAAELARATGHTAAAHRELAHPTVAAALELDAEVAIIEAQLAIDHADPAVAAAHLERAVDLAADPRVRARALAARFAAQLVQPRAADEGHALLALEAFRSLDDDARAAQVLANLGLAALHRGDLALADERLTAARASAERAGDVVAQCGAALFAGLVELDRGRPELAAAHLARAETLALDLGRLSLWSDAVGYGALARLEAGDPSAAADLASHVADLATRGMPGSAPLFAAALHLVDPSRPPPPPASDSRPLIDETVRILAGGGTPAGAHGVQLRIARRLRQRAAAPPSAARERLTVARDRAGFTRAGAAVDLARRGPLRRIFAELCDRHAAGRGPATADELIAAGWPGELIQPESARMRLHNAIAALRSMGLRGLLLTSADGYRLDPDVGLDRAD